MRRYDDPVEVRRGRVGDIEAPEQFVWRERLWVVREVVGHWIETGTWWEQAPVRSLLGLDAGREQRGPSAPEVLAPELLAPEVLAPELLAEREMWRVEAGRGPGWRGIFDLAFDWQGGQWRLVHVLD